MSIITHRELDAYSKKTGIYDRFSANRALKKSTLKDEYDIFISHSYLDSQKILALKNMIESMTDYSVYVDWVDDSLLDRKNVTPETADVLRKRIKKSKILLYAYSENATQSQWVQWELGYADGETKQVAILPIADYNKSSFKGHEFLGLYPYVDKAFFKDSSQESLWVNWRDGTYKELKKW